LGIKLCSSGTRGGFDQRLPEAQCRMPPQADTGTLAEPNACLVIISRARPVVYRSALVALVIAFALSTASTAEAESGLASYYGGRGHRNEMTCAHRTRPFGSMVRVSYAGRSIRCRVNDRGPFIRGRVIDVSTSAARALGMMSSGVVRVSVE
jgi:rare lipoprotein A